MSNEDEQLAPRGCRAVCEYTVILTTALIGICGGLVTGHSLTVASHSESMIIPILITVLGAGATFTGARLAYSGVEGETSGFRVSLRSLFLVASGTLISTFGGSAALLSLLGIFSRFSK